MSAVLGRIAKRPWWTTQAMKCPFCGQKFSMPELMWASRQGSVTCPACKHNSTWTDIWNFHKGANGDKANN